MKHISDINLQRMLDGNLPFFQKWLCNHHLGKCEECRKKITAIADECNDITQVYRLNLQLFPLSKEVAKGKEAKDE